MGYNGKLRVVREITWGSIMTTLTVILFMGSAWVGLSSRVAVAETSQQSFFDEQRRINNENRATQKEDIERVERRIDRVVDGMERMNDKLDGLFSFTDTKDEK